jgi:hypothetical protein
MKLRFQQAAAPGARVDREARVIFGVSLCQTGEALGHGMLVDGIMLAQIADAVNATGTSGIKSRFTHPGACSDAMGKMLGKVKLARIAGDKVIADLHLAKHASKTPDGDLAEYVTAMAEESPADFGMSVAFDGHAVWKTASGAEFPAITPDGNHVPKPADAVGDMPFARVTKLRAVDIVDEPAANRDGLFAAAFSGTSSMAAADMFAALDEARDAMGWDSHKTASFLHSYLSARKITMAEEPAAPAESVEPAKLATECATCGAPIDAEGKYAKPSDAPMQPAEMSAMIDAHPAFAAQIARDFAAGKSVQAVSLGVITAQLAASVTALAAAADALAAEKTAHAKTASRLAALSALGESAIDPGAAPVSGTPVKSEDQIKAAWSALPESERAAFLGDYATYRYHVTNQTAAKTGAQE